MSAAEHFQYQGNPPDDWWTDVRNLLFEFRATSSQFRMYCELSSLKEFCNDSHIFTWSNTWCAEVFSWYSDQSFGEILGGSKNLDDFKLLPDLLAFFDSFGEISSDVSGLWKLLSSDPKCRRHEAKCLKSFEWMQAIHRAIIEYLTNLIASKTDS